MSETCHIQTGRPTSVVINDVLITCFFFISPILSNREDITYRLPELEPRGSDEENMDSETSNSTESLLDDRSVHTVKEGQY